MVFMKRALGQESKGKELGGRFRWVVLPIEHGIAALHPVFVSYEEKAPENTV